MQEVDVLLDVDGVINAFPGRDPRWGWSAESLRKAKIMGFDITWSTELIDALNDLSKRPGVNFYWLTTWLEKAPEELVPVVGLDGAQWPVLGREAYMRENGYYNGKPGLPKNQNSWWKLDAAQEHYVTSQKRFVWIDDDLIDSSAREWARSLVPMPLLSQPDSAKGITKEIFEYIVGWIGAEEEENVA